MIEKDEKYDQYSVDALIKRVDELRYELID